MPVVLKQKLLFLMYDRQLENSLGLPTLNKGQLWLLLLLLLTASDRKGIVSLQEIHKSCRLFIPRLDFAVQLSGSL